MIRIKVLSIKEEKSHLGERLLRILCESNGKRYTFAARKSDYLDETKRKSIQETWMETVRRVREEEKIEKDENKKKDRQDKIARLGKEEVVEGEYYE